MQLKPLLFAVLVLLAPVARAAAVYTVAGIAVDTRAPSVSDARDQAFLDGQRQGFRTLMERLTAPETHASLPEVSGAEAARMVESVAVDQEKAGGNRYLATLTVRYHPAAVQQFLAARGILWSDAQRPRSLIIPLYRQGGTTVLWEEPNPWKQAWDALRQDPPLTPVVVPVGDLGDVQTVTTLQATNAADGADLAALLNLATRYQAPLVDVVMAEPIAGAAQPTVTVTRITLTGTGITRAAPLTVEATDGQLLPRAVDAVLAALVADWRADAGGQAALPESTLRLWMPVVGLQDWLQRRDTLRNVPNVRGVDVLALTPSRVDVAVRYVGTEQELNTALAAVGLRLEMDTPSGWILRPMTMGALPTPDAPVTAVVPPGPVLLPGAVPQQPQDRAAWERTPVQEIGPLQDAVPSAPSGSSVSPSVPDPAGALPAPPSPSPAPTTPMLPSGGFE